MDHEDYMRLSLQLAKAGKGQTSPNPVVGAVIVKDGRIVGMGAHLRAGGPHAEVHALNMAGDRADGAIAYVTLEPCSHYGKTPPCADLLIEKGVRRVFVATTDPNPEVSGRGIKKLKAAGIDVDIGLLQKEANALNRIFFHYIRKHMPFVTLKSAISLDGKIATASGESRWITGKEARKDVHRYRHEHDAILVGVGTVIADNPVLTTRIPTGGKHSIRIILDHHLRTPLKANVVTDGQAETWIVTGSNVSESACAPYRQKGVKIISLKEKKIEIIPLLERLADGGITSLFVEGGAEVNGSFLEVGIANQVIVYIAPKLIGGRQAPTSFAGQGIQHLSNVMPLAFSSIEKLGEDLKLVLHAKEDGPCSRELSKKWAT